VVHGTGLFLLLAPTASVGAEPDTQTNQRIVSVVAQFHGVPEELLQMKSITESSEYGRPVYLCRATIITPDGRDVEDVHVVVDAEALYVTSAGHGVRNEDEMAKLAEEFVRTNFPRWSENMVLQYGSRKNGRVLYRWAERRGGVWTGTFVGLGVNIYRPGAPWTYGAYVATPRSLDDIRVTEEQAVATARQFLAEHDYEGDLQSAELYLDHHLRPYPHWYVSFDAIKRDAPPEREAHRLNVLVDAVTGDVVGPTAEADE